MGYIPVLFSIIVEVSVKQEKPYSADINFPDSGMQVPAGEDNGNGPELPVLVLKRFYRKL